MRVTKYLHSCVLLEEDGHRLLFDPGKFSFIEGRVRPEDFAEVDTVIISHEHPDHVDVEALKKIVGFSQARLIGNAQVVTALQKEGLNAITLAEGPQQIGGFTVQAVAAQHEPILTGELPQNTAHVVNGRVLNPGDSFNSSLEAFAGIELLILPVAAPWLTEPAALDFVRRIQPKQVLPVHDGYAKDFFLKQRYQAFATVLEQHHIKFHPLMEPGASFTL
ncbi:MAG: MBL fold metallo-hydrolase [Chloroflexi bacterium]|nr:MBL fold metallo-hydrolase [Chloroflexota bacterium]OJW00508.1 MAG: MBL fold metallo-hydrolase [Chloroflexi bacterium 54-19]